jgi:hypothetical protein
MPVLKIKSGNKKKDFGPKKGRKKRTSYYIRRKEIEKGRKQGGENKQVEKENKKEVILQKEVTLQQITSSIDSKTTNLILLLNFIFM